MADIKVKRSSVSGKIPLTTDLQLGELAINTTDGKLFLKRNNGVDQIVEVGVNQGSGGAVSLSATPPSNPKAGDTWFYTTTGIKYTYIDDGDSSQWVALETAGSSTSTGGTALPTDSISPFLLMGA